MTKTKPGTLLACAGGALAVVATLAASSATALALVFAAWAALPYAALWAVSRRIERPAVMLGAGAAAVAGELAVRVLVLRSSSSTASLAFLFSPAYILIILMPAGAGLGFVLGGVWEKGGLVARGSVVLAAAGALVFEFFAIAAPEKLPMNVARSKAALARIGEPRVVLNDGLERVLVSTASAWVQPLDIDGRPGEEIALVDARGARFLDVETFRQTSFEPFTAEPGRLWSWMTMLVPLEDGLAAAQTGGGFSETKVQRLDGSLLWTYQPDERVKPTALVPADLDGDRRWEFYAASSDALARLDLQGRREWAAPARSPAFLGVLPKSGATPAWVAAYEYSRRAFALDETGKLIGEQGVNPKEPPFTVSDTPWGRSFLYGGKGKPLRGRAADGRELFSFPLGDFSVVQAVGLDLKSGPALAVLGASTENVGRFRLLIAGEGGRVLYDEILSSLPTLRVARRPGGTRALLVVRDGLTVLR